VTVLLFLAHNLLAAICEALHLLPRERLRSRTIWPIDKSLWSSNAVTCGSTKGRTRDHLVVYRPSDTTDRLSSNWDKATCDQVVAVQ